MKRNQITSERSNQGPVQKMSRLVMDDLPPPEDSGVPKWTEIWRQDFAERRIMAKYYRVPGTEVSEMIPKKPDYKFKYNLFSIEFEYPPGRFGEYPKPPPRSICFRALKQDSSGDFSVEKVWRLSNCSLELMDKQYRQLRVLSATKHTSTVTKDGRPIVRFNETTIEFINQLTGEISFVLDKHLYDDRPVKKLLDFHIAELDIFSSRLQLNVWKSVEEVDEYFA